MLTVHKVLAALPATLAADSVYYVRVGTGVDVYVTNSLGLVVAYPANAPTLYPPSAAGRRVLSYETDFFALAPWGYWQSLVSGTGAAATVGVLTGAQAGATLTTGTTATGRAAAWGNALVIAPSAHALVRTVARMQFPDVVPDGVEAYTAGVGLVSSVSAAPAGAWMERQTTGNLLCSVTGQTAVSVPGPATGTWFVAEVVCDVAAAQTRFYVGGALVATVPGVPSAATAAGVWVRKTLGVTARRVLVDWTALEIVTTR